MIPIADDGLPDDRIVCTACIKSAGQGRWCGVFKSSTIPTLKRRCVQFVPLASDPDQRTGRQRYPDIEAQIEQIRELDRQHREQLARGGKR